jgi:hypothetical protein
MDAKTVDGKMKEQKIKPVLKRFENRKPGLKKSGFLDALLMTKQ